MDKEERKKYIFAQLRSLPNATQYVEVTKYIENLEQQVKKQQEVIDKAIEFTNKNWGTWCSNHCEYMTELQNILKEVSE